jgi:CHAD domain-containing protein
VRALGARALAPPEVVPLGLGKSPTAARFVQHAVAAAVEQILRHDPGVRIGDDPEDVHQARVGTRRLRSDLRTFAPLLEEDWLSSRREELHWLAAALGSVRDADVLQERLRRQAATLPELDAGGLAPLFRRLAKERDEARAELLEVLHSSRYVTLLDHLVAGAAGPPCRPRATAKAADVVPGLVAAPWRKLRRAVKGLPAKPPATDLHRIRILAKRARYASEAAAPLVGRRASRFAEALAGLQTVLGDHQDAMVAEAWLRSALGGADPALALAAGDLIAMQVADAARNRKKWPKAWARASDRKLRAWL